MGVDRRPVLTRRRFLSVAGGVGGATLAGCTSNPNLVGADAGKRLSGSIDIAGSSTVFPLAQAITVEFGKERPNVSISLSKTGTGGGFKNYFSKGQTDFNNASRKITEEERALCAKNGVEPLELHVGKDALTVIVNENADWVDCITVEELREIWKPGGAEKWSDIRPEWPDTEFELFGAADTSGTFDYFTKAIVGEEGKHRDDYQATEKDNIIVQGVTGSKHAMGYLGFAYYRSSQDSVKGLAIDTGDGQCIKPSIETARTNRYKPLTRPLFTYVSKPALAKPPVAEFARYFVNQSTNKQIVTETVGYIPNTTDEMNNVMDELTHAIQEIKNK